MLGGGGEVSPRAFVAGRVVVDGSFTCTTNSFLFLKSCVFYYVLQFLSPGI